MIQKAKAIAAIGRSSSDQPLSLKRRASAAPGSGGARRCVSFGSESGGAFGPDDSFRADATNAPSHRRGSFILTLALALAATLLIVLAGGSGAPPASADTCPNAQLRTGYSAYLPDCRGYELASPPGVQPYIETVAEGAGYANLTQSGQRLPGEAFGVQASATGGAISFFTPFAPAGSPTNGPYFISTRGENGWSTADIVPPQSTTNSGRTCYNAYPAAYTSDLSSLVFADGQGQTDVDCGADDPALVAGEPQGWQNLFSAQGITGPYELINLTPPGLMPSDAWFQAASADLSHVVFDEAAQLTPDAPPIPANPQAGISDDLYVWSNGVVKLVTILPDGTPVPGSLANADQPNETVGPGAEVFTHAVSADGSRVFFLAGGDLYVRERPDQPQSPLDAGGHCIDTAKACTVQVDASQDAGSGGGGTFMWATTDGSQVFFTDDASAGLTADTVPGSGQNLYRYDVDTAQLTDLTPTGDAGVQGMSGLSDDGSYAYLVADGVLAARATAGQPNLYLIHGGATTFIATLDASNDTLDWAQPSYLTARVSSNGQFLSFNSLSSLTGYDNTDASSGEPDQEIFLYDAAKGALSCVSCAPSGAAPTAPAQIRTPVQDETFFHVPGYPQRFLADDGRVFFDTPDPLLARATNSQSNVYEWEPEGVGDCTEANGCLNLISSGTSSDPSYFYDASSSGGDVFVLTTQPLVPEDPGAGMSVYDARVGGGFPAPSPSPTPCSGDACKPPPSGSPPDQGPGSSALTGPGNQGKNLGGSTSPTKKKKCKKGRNLKKSKCVKKHSRAANTNRGGSK